jgi:hypothetical protein
MKPAFFINVKIPSQQADGFHLAKHAYGRSARGEFTRRRHRSSAARSETGRETHLHRDRQALQSLGEGVSNEIIASSLCHTGTASLSHDAQCNHQSDERKSTSPT